MSERQLNEIIYGKVKIHFGNLWAFCSMITLGSKNDNTIVQVSNKMSKVDTVKQILSNMDTEGAEIKFVDEGYSPGQKKYGVRRHKYPYVRTKKTRKEGKFDRICYQLETTSGSWPEKELAREEVEKIINGIDCREKTEIGLPLSLEESIDVMLECDAFVGICSGMAQVAHSVGIPCFLYEWKDLAKCHPNKEYISFINAKDCIEKVNHFIFQKGETKYQIEDRKDLLEFLPKNGVVAELGVLKGDFSQQIYNINKPKVLFLIDCWEEQAKEIYNENSNNKQNTQESFYRNVRMKFANEGNVYIMREYLDECVNYFNNGLFDWVYLDANHSYEACYNDLIKWSTKIKLGGFLCGHDYKATHDAGVIKAVGEFVEKHDWELTYLTNDIPSSYILKRK